MVLEKHNIVFERVLGIDIFLSWIWVFISDQSAWQDTYKNLYPVPRCHTGADGSNARWAVMWPVKNLYHLIFVLHLKKQKNKTGDVCWHTLDDSYLPRMAAW